METKTSLGRFAAICAILSGLSYGAVGITHFLMPRENLLLASGVNRAFFESLALGSAAFSVHYWAFICASLLGIGVVLGLFEIFRSEGQAWLKLSSVCGIIGLSVAALNFGFLHHQALAIAGRFGSLDPSVQGTILAIGLQNPDPYSLMSFGLVGVWSFSVNLLGYRTGMLPKVPALIGCAGGVSFEMVFLGTLMHSELLIDIAAAGAIVLGPVWFIWLGLFLLRK